MTRARFAAKQEPVTVTQIDGVNYFQICLHEQEVQAQNGIGRGDETAAAVTEYEYDLNEWHDATTDTEAVKADPEKYLTYTPVDDLPEPERAKTTEARLAALEKAQEATDQAVQDMIMAQLGG